MSVEWQDQACARLANLRQSLPWLHAMPATRLARTTAAEITGRGGGMARFLYGGVDNQRIHLDAVGPGCLVHLNFFTHLWRVSPGVRDLVQQHNYLIIEVDGIAVVNVTLRKWLLGEAPPFNERAYRALRSPASDLTSATSYVPICFQRRLRVITWPCPLLSSRGEAGISSTDFPSLESQPSVGHIGGAVRPGSLDGAPSVIVSNCTERAGRIYNPLWRCSLDKVSVCNRPIEAARLFDENNHTMKCHRPCVCLGEGGWYFHATVERYATSTASLLTAARDLPMRPRPIFWRNLSSVADAAARVEGPSSTADATGAPYCARAAETLAEDVERLMSDDFAQPYEFSRARLHPDRMTTIFDYRAPLMPSGPWFQPLTPWAVNSARTSPTPLICGTYGALWQHTCSTSCAETVIASHDDHHVLTMTTAMCATLAHTTGKRAVVSTITALLLRVSGRDCERLSLSMTFDDEATPQIDDVRAVQHTSSSLSAAYLQ